MTSPAQYNALPLLSVKPALDASLEKIGHDLELYFASQGGDQAALKEAIDELHRTYGALRLLSLDGVLVFCGEFEKLLQELAAGALQASSLYQDITQRALLGLTYYLNALADGASNAAIRLFSLYEELLQARGIETAFEVDLFFPELNVTLPPPVLQAPVVTDKDATIKHARAVYQQALLKWLRQDRAAEALQAMRGAVVSAMACVPPDAQRAFWWVAAGLLDCLIYDGLPPEFNAKKLLGRIDLQMKSLAEGKHLDVRATLNEMLYLVARSHSVSQTVEEIKQCYALDEYLPEESPRPQGETAQVLDQLRPLVTEAEETWERCVADPAARKQFMSQAEQLYALSERLDRNTLQLLCKQIHAAAAHVEDPDYAQHIVVDMAMALLLVERGIAHYAHLAGSFHEQARILGQRMQTALTGVPDERELQHLVQLNWQMEEREIIALLGQEMQNNLQHVEQELNVFFETPDRREELGHLGRLLNQVVGCLHLLSLDVAEKLLRNSRQAIARYAEGAKPTPAEMRQIATTMSALGAYVQDLTYGQKPSTAALEDVLQGLEAQAQPVPVPTPVAAPEKTARGAVYPAVEATRMSVEDRELLEVFLEEAQEVLEILRTNLDLSQLHPDSMEPLVTIRRGFHTLKGSGRMVGLTDFGEVAWAVERAMNKWLQENKPATRGLLHFIADAEALFHAWVDALHTHSGAMIDATALVEAAQQIENGVEPGAVPGETAPPEAVPAVEVPLELAAPAVAAVAQAMPEVVPPKGPAPAEEFVMPPLEEVLPQAAEQPAAEVITLSAPNLEFAPPEAPAPAEEFVMPRLEEVLPQAAEKPAAEAITLPAPNLEFAPPEAPAPAEEFVMPPLEEVLPQAAEQPAAEAITLAAPNLEFAPPEAPAPAEEFVMPPLEEVLPQAAEQPAAEAITLSAPNLEFAPPEAPAPEESVPPAAEETPPLQPQIEAVAAGEVQPRPEAAGEPAAPPVAEYVPEPEIETVSVGKVTLSASLFNIATEESASNLAVLQQCFAELKSGKPATISYDFMRAAHTLAGVNRTMGFTAVADLSRALELWLEPRVGQVLTLGPGQAELVDQAITMLDAMFLDICNHQEPQDQPELIARLQASQELQGGAEEAAPVQAVIRQPEPAPIPQELAAEFELRLGLEEEEVAPPEVPLFAVMQPVEVVPPAEVPPQAAIMPPAEVVVPFEVVPSIEAAPPAAELEQPLMPPLEIPSEVPAKAAPLETPEQAPAEAAPAEAAARVRQFVEERTVKDELDDQLLPIFLEESNDLQPQIGQCLRSWRASPDDLSKGRELQRGLHTLKGSARMAGAMRLGELTHRMEDRVAGAMARAQRDDALWEELDSYFDRIAHALERLRSGAAIEAEEVPPVPEAAPAAPVSGPAVSVEKPAAAPAPAKPAPQPAEVATERAAAMLRVRPETVDHLVNEAGEISVARSRAETELRSFKTGLLDMTDSLARLRKQLREVEIQAETQLDARVALSRETHEKFDPLEFDRFTRFQELTRFMNESVHDLQTVQQTLLKNLDETSSALSAQAYLNRELQQRLMAIRMVPFSGLSDRLYRIVRQTAKELNKRAILDLRGTEVELDRSVLDKMTAPFEHLLRNAIAHGLESQEERVRRGKPPIGEIRLVLHQESNEVVFELSDDGAGLNLDVLRQKAMERGLFPQGAVITDEDARQLIFNSGISTAETITEISGRGVGMDVVRNEIKALGGRIDVYSERGKGTRFTVYLPLTLAVTQVLMLRVGLDHYAVPSVIVEQVLHIRSAPLEEAYGAGQVEWQGRKYPLRYLPRLLGNEEQAPESRLHNPVLLLRSGDQRLALHVDELLGNQEAVVKNIGPQLARLPGIAGATVLATGKVVLILNPVTLAEPTVSVHKEVLKVEEKAVAAVVEAPALHAVPLVMVVDDSLTVRKVTTRMLQRAGYEVVTAKDGVDALEQLTTVTPAVMLLDVEMPRMDGFELTKQIRRDPKLHNLPILMITSRTAEKHRDYALELGVNAYFGKPFQEEELLRQIASFVGTPGKA
jgi:chemosensory pili system protein ChpA (sensor histidine kinase/response regulator)